MPRHATRSRVPGPTLAAVLMASALLTTSAVTALQQVSDERSGLSGDERSELIHLMQLVDDIAGGGLPGGDAWLKWRPHFLRAPDGDTYVPFTLLIDEAPTGFDDVLLYVRVMERTEAVDDDGVKLDDLTGTATGDLPINMAEKNPNFPNDQVASENSAMAQSIVSDLTRARPARPSYEDVHVMRPERADGVDEPIPPLVRSALSVEPGDYDVYLAVREIDGGDDEMRTAVIVRSISVPDLSSGTLATSSIILVDAVAPLTSALSADEQMQRPYAFGAAEVTPAVDQVFGSDERLSVLFFVYGLATRSGKPDLTVEYRFFKVGITEQLFVSTEPQVFDATTLPADFDLEAAGDQLPVNADVPLASFTDGPYRLEVTVTDGLAGTSIRHSVPFRVIER